MRNVAHIIVSLGMWLLFGYYWYVVLGREIGASTIQALGILSVIIVCGLIATFWWVSHNMRLARRNRRLNPPSTQPETFEHDSLGRAIVAPDLARLRAARIVDVEILADDAAARPAGGGQTSGDQGAAGQGAAAAGAATAQRKVYSIAPEGVD